MYRHGFIFLICCCASFWLPTAAADEVVPSTLPPTRAVTIVEKGEIPEPVQRVLAQFGDEGRAMPRMSYEARFAVKRLVYTEAIGPVDKEGRPSGIVFKSYEKSPVSTGKVIVRHDADESLVKLIPEQAAKEETGSIVKPRSFHRKGQRVTVYREDEKIVQIDSLPFYDRPVMRGLRPRPDELTFPEDIYQRMSTDWAADQTYAGYRERLAAGKEEGLQLQRSVVPNTPSEGKADDVTIEERLSLPHLTSRSGPLTAMKQMRLASDWGWHPRQIVITNNNSAQKTVYDLQWRQFETEDGAAWLPVRIHYHFQLEVAVQGGREVKPVAQTELEMDLESIKIGQAAGKMDLTLSWPEDARVLDFLAAREREK